MWSKIHGMAVARAFSLLGTELTIFTLVFREKNLGPGAIAALFIVGTLPSIIFAPGSGTIADRFSTKRVIPLFSVIGGSAIFAISQQQPQWIMFALLFIANTCASVIAPTWGKLTPLLAAKEDIGRAVGTIQSYFGIAGLFGPALAGLLVSTTGFYLTFLIDGALTIFIAFVPFILKLNHEPEALKPGEKTQVAEGFKFLLGNPLLRSLVILIFGMVLCVSVINVGDVFLITDIMGADVLIYGLVGTFFALGTVLFSLYAGKVKLSSKIELIVLGAGLGMLSLSGLFVGLSPNYWFVMAIWFVAGMANATINTYGVGMMISVTPHEVQGRVFAAFGSIVSVASIGSMSIAGLAIGAFGVREVFVIAGTLAFIAFAMLFPTVYKERIKMIKAS
jgi:DHA3 family macrolide efflux protein-like MFS transporter